MSIPIGEFLYEIRKEIGAMAWEVCDGIVKPPPIVTMKIIRGYRTFLP